jgi:hypothetical protein
MDAECMDHDGLGIRSTVQGERLGSGSDGHPIPPGRLAVADARCIHALLFGDVTPAHCVGPRTEHAALFAISVDGVPAIHVEEALWVCLEVLHAT